MKTQNLPNTGTTGLQDIRVRKFETIFMEYYPVLSAYSLRYVPLHEGEDIVQEVLIWAWQHSDLLMDKTLKNYLFRSVRNNCLTLLWHKEIERDYSLSARKQNRNEDPDFYQYEELSDRFERSLNQLSPAYKQAFELNRFYKMSYKEIAEKLKISPKTVDYRIQQALKKLRKDLKDYI